jgi:hypothetical protein
LFGIVSASFVTAVFGPASVFVAHPKIAQPLRLMSSQLTLECGGLPPLLTHPAKIRTRRVHAVCDLVHVILANILNV